MACSPSSNGEPGDEGDDEAFWIGFALSGSGERPEVGLERGVTTTPVEVLATAGSPLTISA